MITIARTRRMIALIAGTAVIAALATGCSADAGGTGDGDLAPVTFQTSWVPSVQFGGTYLADSKGYYADNGVDVTILPGGPDVDPLAAVASGQADVGLENADTVARANENGAGLVIIAAGNAKNPLVILSSPDNPITTPADMEGKRIGVTSVNEGNEDALVSINGLDASKITTVPVGFDVAPLVSGEVDGLWAIYTAQPVAYEAATGRAGATMLVADFGLDVYTQVYVVTKNALEDPERRAAIEGFLKGEVHGWQDYAADTSEAVQLTLDDYAKDGGLKEADQTKQADLQLDLVVDPSAPGVLWISDEGIQKNLATLKALGITADASMFDTSLLTDIYPKG